MRVGDNGGKPCYDWKGVHIPGCMGCAVYGHSGCTCRAMKKDDMVELLDRISRLEKRVRKLEKRG